MNQKRVLISYPLELDGLHELVEKFDVRILDRPVTAKAELREAIRGCHGILAAGVDMDEEIMDAAPELEIISAYGAGYDNIDVRAATNRGIVVTNVPDAVTDATAEIALGLMQC
jgi:lactate dehydrogenase-like 2-hydroxyacid dehydrogenase